MANAKLCLRWWAREVAVAVLAPGPTRGGIIARPMGRFTSSIELLREGFKAKATR
jgi:hypothetical protein